MLKGALHIHSTYSDGDFTLPELRKLFLAADCSFVCMTDHAEYFDAQALQRYLAECKSLSDEQFCMIPGLEYRCERNMHILGFHANALFGGKDPQDVIRHIDAQGAISVIAHPKAEFFQWIESFSILPKGIEVWNSKYDGRYAPRPGTFALLQKLRQRDHGMYAFYGLDLHWKRQFREFYLALELDDTNESAILSALSSGRFTALKDDLRLPSSGEIMPRLLAEFDRKHNRSHRMWGAFKTGKKLLDRAGIRVPASLKDQLRRIF